MCSTFLQLLLMFTYVAALVGVITTCYYVATIIFHHLVWYRALSLHYACIQSSGIIPIP